MIHREVDLRRPDERTHLGFDARPALRAIRAATALIDDHQTDERVDVEAACMREVSLLTVREERRRVDLREGVLAVVGALGGRSRARISFNSCTSGSLVVPIVPEQRERRPRAAARGASPPALRASGTSGTPRRR